MFLLFIPAKVQKIQETTFFGAKIQHWGTEGVFLLVAIFLRCRRGRHGANCVPAVGRAPPPPSPREPEIPFGRSPSPSLVSAVTSASAVALRHRSLAKRNGAHRQAGEGEKTGGGEDRAVAESVPVAARLFPFYSRCVAPFRKTRQC